MNAAGPSDGSEPVSGGRDDGGVPAPGGDAGGAARTPPGSRREESDTELIRFWYRRHADRVYRYARWRTGSRAAAEEVVSDVFLEAWRSREAFDPEKGSAESWLLGIARNVVRRELREAAREAERRRGGGLDDLATSRPGPEEELVSRERKERLLRAVWSLPKEDRDLVALAYGAELSRRRIARMLDTTPGAVRTRLHRVLKRLRERLGEPD